MKYQLAKTSRLGNRVVNEDRMGVAEHDNAVLLVMADAPISPANDYRKGIPLWAFSSASYFELP